MRRDERGAIAIVACAGALALCLSALAVADIGALLVARSRAQAAADAAALAAVAELVPIFATGEGAEAAAADLAERNGARLDRCDCEGTSATVEVSTTVRVAVVTRWRERRARAVARATLDPDVLSYRPPG